MFSKTVFQFCSSALLIASAATASTPTPPTETADTVKFQLFNTTNCRGQPFRSIIVGPSQEVAAQFIVQRVVFFSYELVDVGANIESNSAVMTGGLNAGFTEFVGVMPAQFAVQGCNPVPEGALRAALVIFTAGTT